MRKIYPRQLFSAAAAFLALNLNAHAAGNGAQGELQAIVDETIRPIMRQNEIPGMAVAITIGGERYFFNYGVASKESGQAVTENTIFEIGSVSKTFTATLGALAQVRGKLSLSDSASKYLPALTGSAFDEIKLLELATYTAGGLPLQFPDEVTDQDEMIAYYKNWQPTYAPGTNRVYSNPSIGLFGYLAARSMGEPFDDLMEGTLIPMLGLKDTYVKVPNERMGDYAYGYSRTGKPVRVNPGMLASEAYGVKTTAADMIRFAEANLDGAELDAELQHAIKATHTGYYRVGGMIQGLGWEMYPGDAGLDRLLSGNTSEMAFEPNTVDKLSQSQSHREDMLINKTGSTIGFGAYVVFAPARNIGIVMLANKNYPNPVRVEAGYRLLKALENLPSVPGGR
ncbi:class C beta-lactamase [Nitratireductor soli]|uniref:class C beta-lactamase n=1 Tax=Nitratireductor soli TaxID=1670619 RepID=UPI00065E20DE|nr:class C beta-lactamase [Nitratireductor soli]